MYLCTQLPLYQALDMVRYLMCASYHIVSKVMYLVWECTSRLVLLLLSYIVWSLYLTIFYTIYPVIISHHIILISLLLV